MSIYKTNLCSCIFCHKEYSVKGIYTHYERNHGTPEQQRKYSNGYNGHYHLEEFKNKFRKPKHTVISKCKNCGKDYNYEKIIDHFERNTCSKSCSASLSNKKRIQDGYEPHKTFWSMEQRKKQSILTKKLWENPNYAKKVLDSNSGRRYFTSKNERIIREYFMQKYSNDGWTYGGCLKIDGELITRDLYSNKLKICFEYDGIWHFNDIHGQLIKKQRKDMLLERWCVINGFSLIRLDENEFNNSSLSMLEKIFYSLNDQTVLKIGNRY